MKKKFLGTRSKNSEIETGPINGGQVPWSSERQSAIFDASKAVHIQASDYEKSWGLSKGSHNLHVTSEGLTLIKDWQKNSFIERTYIKSFEVGTDMSLKEIQPYVKVKIGKRSHAGAGSIKMYSCDAKLLKVWIENRIYSETGKHSKDVQADVYINDEIATMTNIENDREPFYVNARRQCRAPVLHLPRPTSVMQRVEQLESLAEVSKDETIQNSTKTASRNPFKCATLKPSKACLPIGSFFSFKETLPKKELNYCVEMVGIPTPFIHRDTLGQIQAQQFGSKISDGNEEILRPPPGYRSNDLFETFKNKMAKTAMMPLRAFRSFLSQRQNSNSGEPLVQESNTTSIVVDQTYEIVSDDDLGYETYASPNVDQIEDHHQNETLTHERWFEAQTDYTEYEMDATIPLQRQDETHVQITDTQDVYCVPQKKE